MSVRHRIVFACNIYAQRLLSPRGPAARCVELAFAGEIDLFVSEYILGEVMELHEKLPARAAISADDTLELAELIRSHAKVIDPVPKVYVHPLDIDDSPYVDLAVAAKAELIVSRDNHLLGLSDPSLAWAKEFRERFPNLRVLPPDQYLAERRGQLEKELEQQRGEESTC